LLQVPIKLFSLLPTQKDKPKEEKQAAAGGGPKLVDQAEAGMRRKRNDQTGNYHPQYEQHHLLG